MQNFLEGATPEPARSNDVVKDAVIYDTETSGTDTFHGQIFEFAGIRTDFGLGNATEKHLLVRRLPYVVPEPEAMRVTNVDPRTLDCPSRMTEFRAAVELDRFLRCEDGAQRLYVTFNGKSYDDKLLRTTLWRNFQEPYFNSGRGAYRMDVYPATRLACAGDADAIRLPPVGENGKHSFKLEHLAIANDIHIDAHSAMPDTYATRDMALLVREKARWAWNAAILAGHTPTVQKTLDQAFVDRDVVYLHTYYSDAYVAPYAVIGRNEKTFLLGDLRKGPAAVAEALRSDQPIHPDTPLRIVRANDAPLLVSWDVASERLGLGDGHAPAIALACCQRLHERIDPNDVIRVLGRERPETERTMEESIYAGFTGRRDRNEMRTFTRLPSFEDRVRITFSDQRLKIIQSVLVCLQAREEGRPIDHVPVEMQHLAHPVLSRPWHDGERPYNTVEKALADASESFTEWVGVSFRTFPFAGIGTPPPAPDVEHGIDSRPVDLGVSDVDEPGVEDDAVPIASILAVVPPKSKQLHFGF